MDDLKSTPKPGCLASGHYHNFVISLQPTLNDPQAGSGFAPPGLYTWGSSRNNILGFEASEGKASPCRVPFFDDTQIFEVSCGANHSAFIEGAGGKDGGSLWMCGLGSGGRLGTARPETREQLEELLPHHQATGLEVPSVKGSKWCSPCPFRVHLPDKLATVRVSCGVDHTLVITDKGTVFAWGLGAFGNLGVDSTRDSFMPEQVHLPNDFWACMVAAGAKHSMALSTNGEVYSWGHGGNGRLGQGAECAASLVPQKVEMPGGAATKWIAAGEAHSASLDAAAVVHCWGAGSYGRTGHGMDTDVPEPRMVTSLACIPCAQVRLGMLHSLALGVHGTVHAWGAGPATGLGLTNDAIQAVPAVIQMKAKDSSTCFELSGIVEISAGSLHSLALHSKGQLYSWGTVNEGRLGLAMTLGGERMPKLASNVNVPHEVRMSRADLFKVPHRRRASVDSGAIQVSTVEEAHAEDAYKKGSKITAHCGGMNSGIITNDGALWVWGVGSLTGAPAGQDTHEPRVFVVPNPRTKVVAVAFGWEHCLAVTHLNELFTWGKNASGQLGLGTCEDFTRPQRVSGFDTVAVVAAGEDHSAVILSSGELFTWGNNESGKTGHGSNRLCRLLQVPRQVSLDARVIRVSCGVQHTATSDGLGAVYTFGAGWFGRLGHGDMDNNEFAKRVDTFTHPDLGDIPAVPIAEIACGSYHTCMVSQGDHARLWACGRDECLCETSNNHQVYPRLMNFRDDSGEIMNVAMVATAGQHTLVLSKKGSIICFGDNKDGQLCQGADMETVSVPTHIKLKGWARKDKVVSIATGNAHTLALLESGKAYTWGMRSGGRLGLGRIPKFRGRCAPEPMPVETSWVEEEEEDETMSSETVGRGSKFAKVQRSLRDERGVDDIYQDERMLTLEFQDYLKHIVHLLDPAEEEEEEAGTRIDVPMIEFLDSQNRKEVFLVQESTLQDLKARFDRSLCRNLRRLRLADKYPNLDHLHTHMEVASRLAYYEEALTILQQQPCYLARVARVLKRESPRRTEPVLVKVKGFHEEIIIPRDIFVRLVSSIFAELSDERTRLLLTALLRLMVTNEVADIPGYISSYEDVFERSKSEIPDVLINMIMHPFFHDFHQQLLDPDIEGGLMSLIIAWTASESSEDDGQGSGPSKPPSKSQNKAGSMQVLEEILFVTCLEELKEYHTSRASKEHRRDMGDEDERMEHYRARLHVHARIFAQFLGSAKVDRGGRESGREAEQVQQKHQHQHHHHHVKGSAGNSGKHQDTTTLRSELPTFANFLETFDLAKAPSTEYIFKIFKRAVDTLQLRDDAIDHRPCRTESEERAHSAKVHEPVVRLFMATMMGQVLANYSQIISDNVEERILRRCRSRLQPQMQDEQSDYFVRKSEALLKRVLFNTGQLGNFLTSVGIGNADAMEPALRTLGQQLKDNNFYHYMMDMLASTSGDMETLLAVSMYCSHYDMRNHFVVMETLDLCHVGNFLWAFKDPVLDLGNLPSGQTDRFLELLEEMVPPASASQDELEPRLWPQSVIQDVRVGSWRHNLHISHRFLLRDRSICFCNACLVPMPRSLAPMSQRLEQHVRLIRQWVPDPGWQADHTFPYQILEAVLMDRNVPLVTSNTFSGLRSDIEELQRSFSSVIYEQESTDGRQNQTSKEYELVEKLEMLKAPLDLLKNHNVPEQDFFEYVQASQEDRQHHRAYLKLMMREISSIADAKAEYLKELEQSIRRLCTTVDVSESVLIPSIFWNRAQEFGVTLEAQRVLQVKRKEDKSDVRRGVEHGPSFPKATYPLGWLRAKRVVAFMGDQVSTKDYKRIWVTFNNINTRDWEVNVELRKSKMALNIFNFRVTATDLENMQWSGKSSKFKYNQGYIVINGFCLLQLLARIAST